MSSEATPVSRRLLVRRAAAFGLGATLLSGLLAACSTAPGAPAAQPTQAQPAAQPTQAKTSAPAAAGDEGDVSSFVDQAKKEGSVIWLTSTPEAVAKGVETAFKDRYGITVQYLAQNDGILQQRYQSEAQAGNIGADLVTLVPSGDFFESSIQQKWAQSLRDANLPAMALGKFPEKFNQGLSATVFTFPFLIWYRKDKLTGDMVPRSVNDITDPKYRGMVLLTNPASSDGLLRFYDVVQQKYGDEWFQKVSANQPKFFPTASAAVQAMVGGEGALATPAAKAVGVALIESGAPIASATPDTTTGGELRLMLTAPDKAPHPNAARLFANWLVSETGNKAAQGGLAVSPFDKEGLPAGWVESRPITPDIRTKILGLLGVS
jgi:iron(III) transport system substrate-binding protein